jgi:hypothetical protein
MGAEDETKAAYWTLDALEFEQCSRDRDSPTLSEDPLAHALDSHRASPMPRSKVTCLRKGRSPRIKPQRQWQQCGSNRGKNASGRTRTPCPTKAGFSAYLNHIRGHSRTHPDMLIRIVAPKVAGSSPVGHPPTFRIDKPDTQNWSMLRCLCWGCLTPLWHHREPNTVQRAASQKIEIGLDMRHLQARANSCNP